MEPIEIVCLSNSRKTSGRCIAGKTAEESKWVRPVSDRGSDEISEEERRYENGQMPKLLDIIVVPVMNHKPTLHQSENVLIDADYYWIKTGTFDESLNDLLDFPEDLWGKGYSSYQGTNDRLPEGMCANFNESLYLIRPQNLEIIVRVEGGEFGNAKRKVRAELEYNGGTYLLPVTDPMVERRYLSGDNGRFHLSTGQIYLCVSLGLPYDDGYCYKFLASLIETA